MESTAETTRVHLEPSHPLRTPFQRDRDRVLHARAFRRLAGKTQVFTRRFSDHLRSRLTHTLEVTQIARTIARALALNEDLVETLALVHDVGHPPFGHAGERALDEALSVHNLSFDHNLHALGIVEYFEQRYAAFPGINLTFAVREGIIKHSRDYKSVEHPELAAYLLDARPPLEAQLIDIADEIAYLTADLDDGVESGLIDLNHALENLPLLAQHYDLAERDWPGAWSRLLLNEAVKQTLNAFVDDLITHTQSQINHANIITLDDVRRFPDRLASFSQEMEQVRRDTKRYLSKALYNNPELDQEKVTAQQVIRQLFEYWMQHSDSLPPHQQENIASRGLPRAIADYMAGMTDAYILRTYEDVFGVAAP